MKFSGVFFVIDSLSSPFFSPSHLGSPEASKRVPAGVASGVWGESNVGRATVGVDQATLCKPSQRKQRKVSGQSKAYRPAVRQSLLKAVRRRSRR